MKWLVDLEPSGLFKLANAVGRVLFDGAFRHDIPWSVKERTARQIAEVPAMIAALRLAHRALMHAEGSDVDDAYNAVHDVLKSLPEDE